MTGLRVAGLDVLLLLAGAGVLNGAGLVAGGRGLLRLAGLAFLAGLAAVGVTVTALLCAGLPDSIWLVALVALAIAAAGLAVGRRVRHHDRPGPGRLPAPRLAAAAILALIGVGYLALMLRASASGVASDAWDAWGFWIPKARTIYYFGGLDAGPGGITSFANPDYPPLLPAFSASVFAFAGEARAALLPVQEWLLVVAFLWAIGGLLLHRVAADVLAFSLLLVLLMPDVAANVGASLGDLPLSILVGTGALCCALWVVERSPGYVVVAGVLLAGAAVTKKEGLSLALLVVVATFAAAGLRRWRPPAAVALAVVCAVVPWHLWLHANHVVTSGDYQLHDLLDPGYLASHASRLRVAIPSVSKTVLNPNRWDVVLPLALAAALAVLPRRRALAVLPIVFSALGVLGLLIVYWISLLPIHYHLDTSVSRTVMPIVFVGAALLPLLLGEALSAEQRVRGAPEPVLEVDRRLEAEHLAGG